MFIVPAINSILTYTEEEQILERLETINNLYGRGNIIEVNYEKCFIKCQKQYGIEKAKFILKGDTVYCRGHQSNWRKPYRY